MESSRLQGDESTGFKKSGSSGNNGIVRGAPCGPKAADDTSTLWESRAARVRMWHVSELVVKKGVAQSRGTHAETASSIRYGSARSADAHPPSRQSINIGRGLNTWQGHSEACSPGGAGIKQQRCIADIASRGGSTSEAVGNSTIRPLHRAPSPGQMQGRRVIIGAECARLYARGKIRGTARPDVREICA